MILDRNFFLERVNQEPNWDIIIVGGGATGLGSALDAASRGFKTLLLEQADFAKGTSSRSTKLVHGGVRYLAQGNVALVYEALHERGLLLKNAPHLVKEQEFIIPVYSFFSKLKYLVGLKLYDLLAGKREFKKSSFLSVKEVLQALPGLKPEGLTGGIRYSDGQFDDARLAVNIAQTCAEHGGVLLNYMKVTGLCKPDGRVTGVKAWDIEKNRDYEFTGKVIINATGVFVDDILQMDVPSRMPIVRPSQGAHIVLDKSFLNSKSALMIPETDDGRVLFAVPWNGHVLVGTTDTPLNTSSLEPVALEAEVDFILTTASKYLVRPPKREDVLSVFAGLRPLAAPGKDTDSTKEISRSHKLIASKSGLITITGGKWTTYRKMAEDVIDKAIITGNLAQKPCNTKNIRIHGYREHPVPGYLSGYGSDQVKIQKLADSNPELNQRLIPTWPYIHAEVVWAVRNEMARTVEDVLARRMRILFLDARTAMQLAPAVAKVMAGELGYGKDWETQQAEMFNAIASLYLLKGTLSAPSLIHDIPDRKINILLT